MIFQDPLNSLNPVMKVGDQISEVFLLHQKEIMQDALDKERLERKENKQKYKQLNKKLKDDAERLTKEEVMEREYIMDKEDEDAKRRRNEKQN